MDAAVLCYDSIHRLPLARFIDAAVDNNLQALVITGSVDEEKLIEVWNDLQQQYNDAIGSKDINKRKQLIREITAGKIKLFIIQKTVEILQRYYVAKFADRLNQVLGTKYIFDVTKPEEYDSNLKSALLRAREIKVDVDIQEKTLEALSGEMPADNNKLTREHFSNILITLSDHAGYELDEEKIMTGKFAERIRRFNKYCEDQSRRKK